MEVVIGGGGLGGGRDVVNEGVHSEEEGYHCGINRKFSHLRTVHEGVADSGINQVHAVVGIGC